MFAIVVDLPFADMLPKQQKTCIVINHVSVQEANEQE